MTRRTILLMSLTVLTASILFARQASQPVVSMSVTLPDGQTTQLSTPESGLATITLKDGTEIGFRPTIQDSKPWTRVVVTIFKMPTASHASGEIGQVEVKTGAPAVQTKTTPAFKVAVTKVSEPTS